MNLAKLASESRSQIVEAIITTTASHSMHDKNRSTHIFPPEHHWINEYSVPIVPFQRTASAKTACQFKEHATFASQRHIKVSYVSVLEKKLL